MTILTRVDINCTTGVITEVPLTPEEISDREASLQASIAREEAEQAAADALAALKASAKAKLIAGEPLTAEEADTLVI